MSIQSITCPKCRRTSYNLNDVKHRYCGYCHQFHEFMGMPVEIKSYTTGLLNCPHCGVAHELATNAEKPGGPRPQPGSVSVCVQCAGVSEFIQEGLILKLVPFDENRFGPQQRAQIQKIKTFILSRSAKA